MQHGVAIVRTIHDVIDVTYDTYEMDEPLHRSREVVKYDRYYRPTVSYVPMRPEIEPVDLDERAEARVVDLAGRRSMKPVVTKARIEKRARVALLRPAVYEDLVFTSNLESERLRFPGFIPEDTKPTAPRRKHNTGRKPMKRYTRDSIRTAA